MPREKQTDTYSASFPRFLLDKWGWPEKEFPGRHRWEQISFQRFGPSHPSVSWQQQQMNHPTYFWNMKNRKRLRFSKCSCKRKASQWSDNIYVRLEFPTKLPVSMELLTPASEVSRMSQSLCLTNVKCFRAQRIGQTGCFSCQFAEINLYIFNPTSECYRHLWI